MGAHLRRRLLVFGLAQGPESGSGAAPRGRSGRLLRMLLVQQW